LEFVSYNEKEFCNNLAKEFIDCCKSNIPQQHLTGACNSQAEVANKKIQKYLALFTDKTTLDWPVYMAPMAFAYSIHWSIKTTLFFLSFGMDPRYPGHATLPLGVQCRKMVQCNKIAATKTQQHKFSTGQMVLINKTNYLGQNFKLASQWTGPHLLLHVLENGVVELLIKNHLKRRIPQKLFFL
jgi:hypothetical protein